MKCENCKNKEAVKTKYNSGRFCSKTCSSVFSKSFIEKTKEIKCIECGKETLVGKRAVASKSRCKDCSVIRRIEKSKKYYTNTLCVFCGGEKLKNKSICETCRVEYYDNYRFSANFDFDLKIYSEFFDTSLIKKHGKYSPSNKGNNLNGVSRDHMFSVSDGFKFGIPVEIIKHPANCKFMLHKENQKKYKQSSITLEQLINRIRKFEKEIKTSDTISKKINELTRCLSGLRGQSAKLLSES